MGSGSCDRRDAVASAVILICGGRSFAETATIHAFLRLDEGERLDVDEKDPLCHSSVRVVDVMVPLTRADDRCSPGF